MKKTLAAIVIAILTCSCLIDPPPEYVGVDMNRVVGAYHAHDSSQETLELLADFSWLRHYSDLNGNTFRDSGAWELDTTNQYPFPCSLSLYDFSIRVPAWVPLLAQEYYNGHQELVAVKGLWGASVRRQRGRLWLKIGSSWDACYIKDVAK